MTHGKVQISAEDLMDRAKAFETFRKSYRKNEAMEENRQKLKDLFQSGKSLGQDLNETRIKMKGITNQIEKIRQENAMRGNVDAEGNIHKTPEEMALQNQLVQMKQSYNTQYHSLKEMKSEIEWV